MKTASQNIFSLRISAFLAELYYRGVLVPLFLILLIQAGFAATPPLQVNYQGMLNDANDQPLSGTFDMTFRFFDASSGGALLLTDSHTGGSGVTVTAGLFDAALGGGAITPGTEGTLGDVFGNHSAVFVELQVGTETLAPRIQMISSAFSLNAGTLNGLSSTSFAASVHTHSAADITSGTLPAARGGTGSDTSGAVAGSILRAAGGGLWSAIAPGSEGQIFTISGGLPSWVNNSSVGGSGTAGFLPKFLGSSIVGNSIIAEAGGKIGIGTSSPAATLDVVGSIQGNYPSGVGVIGIGGTGVQGLGSGYGGLFASTAASGYAYLGHGDEGIDAYGSVRGGYFADTDGTSQAALAYGTLGVVGLATTAGGFFQDSDSTGYAYVGYGDEGIEAYGNVRPGFFKNLVSSGTVTLAFADQGVTASGNEYGGFFFDADGAGYSYLGHNNHGIEAYGSDYAGFFNNTDNTSAAVLGGSGTGIEASGSAAGGFFISPSSGAYGNVGYATYKISGIGSVAFMQNHPAEKDRVIVYNAPEGDEVATYTRGTARLQHGTATVPLGDTFKWVTNPDIGLTAYVTARQDCKGIFVESVTPSVLVVKELDGGTDDVTFDYIVYGLRIGFEETSIVQEKEREAYIPAMTLHRQTFEQHPELRQYNALERFETMRTAAGDKSRLDLSASQALRDAIHEFNPAVDKLDLPSHPAAAKITLQQPPVIQSPPKIVPPSKDAKPRVPATKGQPSAVEQAGPMDSDGNFYAKSFRSASEELARSMPVSQQVELGDVVVVDRANRGWLKLGDIPADPGVVGVISSEPGVLLGGKKNTAAEKDTTKAPVALSGIVQCKVDASYGAIEVGDLLTTSATPGFAMKAQAATPGTVLGKALDSLESGAGVIEILIMHQ